MSDDARRKAWEIVGAIAIAAFILVWPHIVCGAESMPTPRTTAPAAPLLIWIAALIVLGIGWISGASWRRSAAVVLIAALLMIGGSVAFGAEAAASREARNVGDALLLCVLLAGFVTVAYVFDLERPQSRRAVRIAGALFVALTVLSVAAMHCGATVTPSAESVTETAMAQGAGSDGSIVIVFLVATVLTVIGALAGGIAAVPCALVAIGSGVFAVPVILRWLTELLTC